LQSFGKEGLTALANAVKRELANNPLYGETINLTVNVPHQNKKFTVKAKANETLYDLSRDDHDIHEYLECSCRGITACSTCHVYIENPDDYKKIPEPEEGELDMLDLAWGYKEGKSRLGCQIKLTKELDGLEITIPKGVNNLY
jgi:ferredoxin